MTGPPRCLAGRPLRRIGRRRIIPLVAPLLLVPVLLIGLAPLSPLVPPGVRAPAARAVIASPYLSEVRVPVAPGVSHDVGTIATDTTGRQAVHIVDVSMADPNISLEASLSGDKVTGRLPVSAQAHDKSQEGHRVVAAVNGDVWAGYSYDVQSAPNGVHVQWGELMVGQTTPRPTFGIGPDGRPRIGSVAVSLGLTTPDGVNHPLNRLNQQRRSGEAVLYTTRFGSQTTSIATGVDVVLTGVPDPLPVTGTFPVVVAEVRAAAKSAPIAPGTAIVTGPGGTWFDDVTPGTPMTLQVEITSGWADIRHAVGGREFIARDGATFISPRPAKADEVHPRSAIGITATGDVVIATVDGRQSPYSTGVTLDELAALMISRGAVQAINLDGGGSTTMAIRQPGDAEVSVVNRPSDGQERLVTNAILVVSAYPSGPLAMVGVSPASASVYQAETVDFGAKGQDAAYNAVALDGAPVAWSLTSPVGTIDSSGLFTATTPGTATVTASVGGMTGTAVVTVLADTTAPVATGPLHRLVTGTSLGTKDVPVALNWRAATDDGTGVTRYELQGSVDGGPMAGLPPDSALGLSKDLLLRPGHIYRYELRAIDAAGNASPWVSGWAFRLGAAQGTSTAVIRKGPWTKSRSVSFYGSIAISTTRTNASAAITFTGRQIAWVALTAPNRGTARVYVDGTLAETVDLQSDEIGRRVMVFTKIWGSNGRHTLEIRASGTAGRPRIDVDAFVTVAQTN